MKGTILAVHIAPEKGCRTADAGRGRLVAGLGLENDAHAGTPLRQGSLLAMERRDKLRAKGLDAVFGDFAENLTTRGIDLPSLSLGTRLRVGSTALLEVAQIDKVCHNRCRIFYTMGDCVMPREGVFVKVLRGGEVAAGDPIEVLPVDDRG
jgi:MOSC domain-containing protein YiiM